MEWDNCRDAFHADGSMRDIYVLNTTTEDWRRLFDAFLQFERTLYCDGDPTTMIEDPATIFEGCSEHHYLLKVLVRGVALHCHFFTIEEI